MSSDTPSGGRPPPNWIARLEQALVAIAARDGKPKPFEVVLTHGTARIGVYAPRGSDPQQPHDQDEVYVVARGQIVRGRGRRGVACDTYRRLLGRLAEDERVAAVVLRIDSPGGEVVASDLLWRAVQLLGREKPVVASLGDTAASGG